MSAAGVKRPKLTVRVGGPDSKRRRRSGASAAMSAPSSAAAAPGESTPADQPTAAPTDKSKKTTEASSSDVGYIVSDTALFRPRTWRKVLVATTNMFGEEIEVIRWVSATAPKARRLPDSKFEARQRERATFKCTVKHCMKAFLSQTSLDRHLRFHDQRQFVCSHPGCGKSFGDSSKLKRHMLVHTGERRFLCPVPGCGKRFSLDFNLRTHLRVHESHERKRQQREEEMKRIGELTTQQQQPQTHLQLPQPHAPPAQAARFPDSTVSGSVGAMGM
mmetsp:Transcript_16426/g.52264  ORF Transcript_16426/g.52264 Transcript_16426/m.52264 type:complete len:275 (+) Transcript_16426:3-827(+)